MTEDEIRRRAKEAGLSGETADSMVESSRVADSVRRRKPIAWYIADDSGEVCRATGCEVERDAWRLRGLEVKPLYP